MPPVRSLDLLFDASSNPDGVQIVSTHRGTIVLRRNTLPTSMRNKTAAEIETYINNTFIPGALTFGDNEGTHWYFYAAVKVLQANPLRVNALVSDHPITARDWEP